MAEVYQIDLDEEILSHLADPESVSYLRNEEMPVALIEDETIRDIYQWQLDHIHEHKQPASASVLVEQFDLELDDPLTAIGDLLDRLRLRYTRNNSRRLMERVSDAYKEDPALVVTVLPEVARELTDMVGKRGESYGTGDYERAMSKYDQTVLRGPGPSLGFDLVNKHFHGAKGLTFFIAPPKTYKSWVGGVNVLVDNVLQGNTIDLASLELPADETDMRARCLTAGVPYWRYLRGQLSQDDRQLLKDASEFLDDEGRYNIFKPEPGHRTLGEMVRRSLERGADSIIIDQLQYVETKQGKQLGSGDTGDYWAVLNEARDLSDEIPIIIIHQFNRTVMNAEKMPEMQQAKGSASIEETATLALGLWANKDMRRSNVVELGTLASRNYTFESWEIGIDLSHSCDFQMLGRIEDEED